MHNFDRSAVKHDAQNIQNATSGFLKALECTEFVFERPRPYWRSLQRSTRPSWFKGPYF